MPKTLSATIETVAQASTNQPHYLFEIALDGGTQYYTDNNANVNFPSAGGQTYTGWGITFDRIRESIYNEVDSVKLSFDNSDLSMSVLLAANEFQGKTLTIKKVFAGYLDSASNYIEIFRGEINEISADEDSFQMVVRSPLSKLNQDIPRRTYQNVCPWTFGSAECNRFSGPQTSLVGHWPLSKDHENNGGNLVYNGGMEADDSSWTDYGTPTTTERSSEQAHSGTYSWKVVTDGSADEGIRQTISSGLTVGKAYRIIAWVYVSATTDNIKMYLNSALLDSTTTTGSWEKLEAAFIYAAGNILYFYTSNTKTGTFYVDDVSVTEIYTKDESTNSNHGYPNFLPTYATGHESLENEALVFDGTNDYVSIPDDDDYTATNFTLTAWVKTEDTDGSIISKYWGANGERSWQFIVNSNKLYFGTSDDGTAATYTAGVTDINDGVFHCVCAVKTAATATLYVDGENDAVGYAKASIYNNANDVVIGAQVKQDGTTGAFLDADMEDIRYYRSALNATEVQLVSDVTWRKTDGVLTATYSSNTSVLYDNVYRAEADDFWNYGVVEMTSGACNRQIRRVSDFSSASGKITVHVPFTSTPSDGDTYTIKRGCNKTSRDCVKTHDNFINFGGFVGLPNNESPKKETI